MGQKPDKDPDRTRPLRLGITKRQFQIYQLLTQAHLSQTRVSRRIRIKRQTVNEHTATLETLGLITPIDPNGNPKFYRTTLIIPVVTKSSTPVVSGSAKKRERSLRKTPILVRDHKTGKIKKWKSNRRVGCKRDYNTVISVNGKRLPMVRAHNIAYSCTIIKESLKKIPWEEVDGMKGMKQYVYRFKFKKSSSALFDLREIEVTYLRQKTADTDELIIYLPEKYFIEYELEQGEKILEEYAWKAWKWFQKMFCYHLSYPSLFRQPSYAREIDDPKIKNAVEQHGLIKVKTDDGDAVADESKKGFYEQEFPTIEQVKEDLHKPEKLNKLESKVKIHSEELNNLKQELTSLNSNLKEVNTSLKEVMVVISALKQSSARDNRDTYIDVV